MMQGAERGAIEAVARGDPDGGFKRLRAQDADSLPDPFALKMRGDADEFIAAMQGNESPAARGAEMTVAVKADGSTGGLQRAHLWPEIWVRRGETERGVAVVGHDGEDGLELVAVNECENLRPG